MDDKKCRMNAEEEKLIKLYKELTGASESCARNVFMLVSSENRDTAEAANELSSKPPQGEPVESQTQRTALMETVSHRIPEVLDSSSHITGVR